MNGAYPAQMAGRGRQAFAGAMNFANTAMPFRGQTPVLKAATGATPPQPAGGGLYAMPSGMQWLNSTRMSAPSSPNFNMVSGNGGAAANPYPYGGGPPGSTQGFQTLSNDPLWGKIFSAPTMPGDVGNFRQGMMDYLTRNIGNMNAQTGTMPGQVSAGGPMMLGGQFGGYIPQLGRGQIQDVMGQNVSANGVNTQSVDQLGGMNSSFFQNMMGQLSPLFQQQTSNALAQAKEASGNLTGSGFANNLGQAVGQVLPQQQALLAQYAQQGIGQELGRQQQLAGLAQERNLANAQFGQQANMANQSADMNFLNQLLQRGSLGNQAEQLGLQQGMANQGAQQGYDLSNAQMEMQRQLAMFQGQNDINNSNAQRYAALAGQFGNQGVGPNEIIQQNGLAALAGPLGGILGQLLANRGAGGGGGGADLGSLLGLGGGSGGGYSSTSGLGGLGVGDVLGGLGQSIWDKIPGSGAINSAIGGASNLLGSIPGAGLLGGIAGSPIGMGLGLAQQLGLFGNNMKTGLNQVVSAVSNPVGTVANAAKKAGGWLKKHLFSDERLKTNFVPLGNGLYQFDWKHGAGSDIGFKAQEVKRYVPSAVRKDPITGYYQVDYGRAPEILEAIFNANSKNSRSVGLSR